MKDQLFTVREVAKHCHVEPRTVRNWLKKGLASQALTLRGDRLILEEDLKAFLKSI